MLDNNMQTDKDPWVPKQEDSQTIQLFFDVVAPKYDGKRKLVKENSFLGQ